MRKVTLFCAVMLTLTCACAKKKPNEQKIIGKWHLKKTFALDAKNKLVRKNTKDEDNGDCPPDLWEFRRDNSYTTTDYNKGENCNNAQVLRGDWEINKDSLFMFFSYTAGGTNRTEKLSFEIKSLTDSALGIMRNITSEMAAESGFENNVAKLSLIFKKANNY